MNIRLRIIVISAITAALFTSSSLASSLSPTLAWTQHFGNNSNWETFTGVSADGQGNIYTSGYAVPPSPLPGHTQPADYTDAILTKYTDDGTLIWTRQLECGRHAESRGVSTDGSGNVYICGNTSEAVDSNPFIAKYAADGSLDWATHWGSNQSDECLAIAADALGNVYVCGNTYGELAGTTAGDRDAFLAKYTPDGIQAWVRQFGSVGPDSCCNVAVDSLGHIYVSGTLFTGTTYDPGSIVTFNPENYSTFIAKYTDDGTEAWTKQLTISQSCYGMSVDGLGNAYLGGYVHNLEDNTEWPDSCLAKYAPDGTLTWMTQWDVTDRENRTNIATDALGNIYTTGFVSGDLEEDDELFLTKHATDGELAWMHQWSDSPWNMCDGISTDNQGNVYVAGGAGTTFADADAVVMKWTDVPEPSTYVVLGMMLLAIFGLRNQSSR